MSRTKEEIKERIAFLKAKHENCENRLVNISTEIDELKEELSNK